MLEDQDGGDGVGDEDVGELPSCLLDAEQAGRQKRLQNCCQVVDHESQVHH